MRAGSGGSGRLWIVKGGSGGGTKAQTCAGKFLKVKRQHKLPFRVRLGSLPPARGGELHTFSL